MQCFVHASSTSFIIISSRAEKTGPSSLRSRVTYKNRKIFFVIFISKKALESVFFASKTFTFMVSSCGTNLKAGPSFLPSVMAFLFCNMRK